MRENFKGNKRRKEELRKKRQEEKRNKRLSKRDSELSGAAENSVTSVAGEERT